MKLLKEIYNRRELLWNLVVRNLKIRYKGSVLGFFWSFLDPLFMMLVYLLFIKLMRFSIDLPVLLIGVVVWQFFVMCTNDSVNSITGSTNLVKKVYFPRMILPLAIVIANLINFLLSLGVLIIILLFFKIPFGLSLSWFPLIIFLQFVFCLGIALIVSTANVFFRDTEHLMGVIIMTWFFVTPIIYPLDKIPVQYLSLYFLNPMASILTFYRYSLLGISLPAVNTIYFSFFIGIGVFFIGMFLFARYQKYFADEL
jgi:ABC-2 type transport system permease protein